VATARKGPHGGGGGEKKQGMWGHSTLSLLCQIAGGSGPVKERVWACIHTKKRLLQDMEGEGVIITRGEAEKRRKNIGRLIRKFRYRLLRGGDACGFSPASVEERAGLGGGVGVGSFRLAE